MEGLVLLVIAGLTATLAVTLGFWGWRRLLRTASLETAPRAAAVALRAPSPQLAGGDDDVDRESVRTSPRARSTLARPGHTTAAVPVEPAPTAPEAAAPIQDLGEELVPAKKDMAEAGPHPSEPCMPARPPRSPPPTDDATVPVVLGLEGGNADGHELKLPSAVDGEPVPEIAAQGEAPEFHDVTLPADATGPDDAARELTPSGTADACGNATPAAATGEGDLLEEDGIPKNPAGADPPAAEPDAELGAGDCGAEAVPSLAAEELTAESAAHVDMDSAAPDPKPEPPAGPTVRRRQPAIHRDRRGERRTVAAAGAPLEPAAAAPGAAPRPPAEAKLRLSLHPIRRTARLSIVLTRPDGFPSRVTVQEAGSHPIGAYDEQRYDDLDLAWTGELLDGEIRLTSTDGFQWLRSARQVHIFAEDPNEPELISVSAARPGIAHALVCRSRDTEAVRLAVLSTGSSELQTHEHWQGIPDSWVVLSGYTPVHAATPSLAPGLRPLDPGEGLEISFDGGLAIRTRVYAAGHPPRISISPAPGAASVTIGGEPAALSSDGAWAAPGWDAPGQHIVDVVPGPSASYEIAADPWMSGGWEFWDAHSERFGDRAREPWARARICGALIRGPADETVFAAETRPTLVALGTHSGATPLRRRDAAAVSVGLMAEPPAFLLSAKGPRRTQGRVIWLGLAPAQNISRRYDAEWVATVRSAAGRRLPLEQADALGEDAWRKAKERARRLRSRRPRA